MHAWAKVFDSSWLFYTSVRLDGGSHATFTTSESAAAPSYDLHQVNWSYCIPHVEGESEREKLLHGVFTSVKVDKLCDKAELLRQHERFMHRDMRDTALMEGLRLPKELPACKACLESKSKRHTFTGGSGSALHDAVYPGHTIGWDHCGPFNIKTWAGNFILSLKVDLFSGKLWPEMTTTTACSEEWQIFYAKLKSQGKSVAQLLTDRAAYFLEGKMGEFNEKQGIEHIAVPAYSQEFNAVIERTFGTLLPMVRTALIASCAPERAYGECFVAACYTLDRLLHKTGGRLSRLEKWKQRLIPDQRKYLRPWGCAAYVHLDHGVRGHIGGVGRAPKAPAAAKAALGFLVGYESHSLGWRICLLPSMRIIETPHVRFQTDRYPCRAELTRELDALPLFESQPFNDYAPLETAADTGDAQASALPSESTLGSGRRADGEPTRVRQLSERALHNLPDVDVPPEVNMAALEVNMAALQDTFADVTELIYKAEGGDTTNGRSTARSG